jgi:SAM-dependent methyltransferase
MHVDHCRVCGDPSLLPILDLGVTALANSFLRPDQASDPEPRFPLRLVLCQGCGLVQLDEKVPPELMFKHYLYVTGTSDLARSHAQFLASSLSARFGLSGRDRVFEAASNDGTVLRAFQQRGLPVLGIEPAENIAARAAEDGVPTRCAFFGTATADRLRAEVGPAKLILARHVLAHVDDQIDFARGLARVLTDDGVAVVECPWLAPFFEQLEYDTVYHEHHCYFSVAVLQELFRLVGLELIDVSEVAIHGGSVLVVAQRQGGPRPRAASVGQFLRREDDLGLRDPDRWAWFATQVEAQREALREELARLARAGQSLAGYGAPAKGMTLLAYCGIGPDQLPYIVDKSPYKQGLLTPGHHIPVLPAEELLRRRPDVTLLLSWNFAAEVVRQQEQYTRRGGRFLLPLPGPRYHRPGKPVLVA